MSFPDHCSPDAIASSRELGHFQARVFDMLRALDGAEGASPKASGLNASGQGLPRCSQCKICIAL